METVSLPQISTDDPRMKLQVENRMKNIFVTQLEDAREEEVENVNHIPIITEATGRILETGVNTLQRTLVLKKQVEVDEADRELALKRQEFKDRIQALGQRRAEFELKQQANKERAVKFEKFVQDNEAKRRRAQRKYVMERKQNELKQREREELLQQLEKLQARQHYLKERVTKYKIYEDYLLKILDLLPENYLEYGADSLVMPIIRRHETLAITHQELVERLGSLVEDLELSQRSLENLKQEHDTNKLMTNRKLSELQTQWDRTKERNKQLEMNLQMHQGQSRDEIEETGSLLIAVKNLGEQCHLPHYGPLDDMSVLPMMDMIKEFILEKADVERRAMRLMDCGSAVASSTELSGTREKGSALKNSSKALLKSTSKTSSKSGLFSGSILKM
ncbi:coiled-coil domain-containing protein 42 homolog [Megalops cyprinoides]|uniref:coiled-coil domain-containing protein 42 homolog n=1 Tax=Megalops cyprinoides TaxID=118141 RepID=UPI001864CE20|nr:coiled-coil domain-containing protein 42 homolog [Megalops cyprinoides]